MPAISISVSAGRGDHKEISDVARSVRGAAHADQTGSSGQLAKGIGCEDFDDRPPMWKNLQNPARFLLTLPYFSQMM
jgi:hypothetical protein